MNTHLLRQDMHDHSNPERFGFLMEKANRDGGVGRLQIVELGKKELSRISATTEGVDRWRNWLSAYLFDGQCPDEEYVWFSCILALKAVDAGNFGIGAVLVDKDGKVVTCGHNQVFSPYFRSDRHAEMVVMNQFEDSFKMIETMDGITLYTSLEPCPMCLARLITSGIGRVMFAVGDEIGGMVARMRDSLPGVWLDLADHQTFGLAKCSSELTRAAKEIFLLNVKELNDRLLQRSGKAAAF